MTRTTAGWIRRLRLVPVLAVPAALAACGHSEQVASLSVTCGGSLQLAGATSVQVNALATGTQLSFPDPANPGHTGTLPVQSGQPCTIALQLDKKGQNS